MEQLESSVRAFAVRLRETVGCDATFVFGLERTGAMLAEVARDGTVGGFPMPTVHRGQSLTGRALVEGDYLATDDYARLPYKRLRGLMLGIRSLCALPLVREGRAYGVVLCISRQACGYELRETELSRHVAAIPTAMADAIEVLGETRFQRAAYDALEKLVLANSERLPLELACANISESAAQTIGADYVVVGRRTAVGTTTYHGTYGVVSTTWRHGTISYAPLALDYEAKVESGETIVVDLTRIEEGDEAFAQSAAEGGQTLVIVPIVARGTRIGTLVVGWRTRVDPPRRALDLLQTFAAQASVAVTDEWRKDDATMRAELEIARATNRSAAAELHKALANDALEIVYQPIFDLATGRIVEVEALARWPGAPGPFEDPELFVRLAEEYGAIARLTDRVVYRALRDIKYLPADVRIAINVSMVNLLQLDFAKRLLRIFAVADVSPTRFAIELTETVSIVDRELGSEAVADLARAGVGVSIDDFGEGYAALSYLKMFPATSIKIHRRYVSNVRADAYDDAIVRSIVELAHRVDIAVVAEGVEDAAVLGFLRTIGCDRVQGYACGRPMTIENLRAFLVSPQANIATLGA